VKEWDYVIETLITADEAGLVIFWLKDESLEESDNLPDLDVLPRKSSSLDSLRSGRP
jgi:hypothetical protein